MTEAVKHADISPPATPPTESNRKAPVLKILFLALPVLLITLFYILRGSTDAMDWANTHIFAPYRNAAGAVSEFLTFGSYRAPSLTEIIYTAGVLLLIFFLVRTVVLIVKRRGLRIRTLLQRLFVLLLVALYIWAGASWLWGCVYAGYSFSEKSGLDDSGVSIEELTRVTEFFAAGANAYSTQVSRDDNGHFNESMAWYFERYGDLYTTEFREEFPCLTGKTRRPVSMFYSFVMSMTNFTGFYFPLTGQSNLNTDAPSCLIPSTISHELAHQLGVAAENEANFVGIAACITCDNAIYKYSGYLSGLIHMLNALYSADRDAWAMVHSTLSPQVQQDLRDNNEFWSKYETKTADAVSAVYDTFLKSNGQELGIRSYGACVNLLVHWLVCKGI